MRTVIAIAITALVAFAGCKINPAVLEAKGTTDAATTQKTAAAVTIAAEDNIVPNPGFEDGINEWTKFGNCEIDVVSEPVHGEYYSGIVTKRNEDYAGIAAALTNIVEAGKTYNAYCWVALAPGTSANFQMTYKQTDGAGTKYKPIGTKKATGNKWVQVSGKFKADITGDLKEFTIYIEGPAPGVDYYVDDVAVAVAE